MNAWLAMSTIVRHIDYHQVNNLGVSFSREKLPEVDILFNSD